MTNVDLFRDLDPTPLVAALTEKTREGKLIWEPTAADNTFIVSLGGENTLRIELESEEDEDDYGQPVTVQRPTMKMLDSKGKTIWEIPSSKVKTGLWPLFRLVQRVAYKLDEKMSAVLEALEKL